jgi:hypothetical protein
MFFTYPLLSGSKRPVNLVLFNSTSLERMSAVLWASGKTSWLLTQSSIPGAARFSEEQWVWNGVHSALVRINEELRERKVAPLV